MPTRPRHPMPDFVREALAKRHQRESYDARPPYQRNDYIAWIGRARSQETRERRLEQMLDELQRGGVYMGMAHKPSAKTKVGRAYPSSALSRDRVTWFGINRCVLQTRLVGGDRHKARDGLGTELGWKARILTASGAAATAD